MSNIRDNIPTPAGDLAFPAEGDLAPYVIFTQLKEGGPHIYAGWLDAADDAMALQFAKEHYGQDQVCVSGYLDIVRMTWQHRDRPAAPFDQRGIVGAGITTGMGPAMRLANPVTTEGLGGLNLPEQTAVQCRTDPAVKNLFDRILGRNRE